MGTSQSTSRAAKFSGNSATRRSVRVTKSAPSTDPTIRRTTSVRNTNRNVKEFSKFWSDGGNVTRSKQSATRSSTRRSSTKVKNGTNSTKRNRSVDQLSNAAGSQSSTSTRRASHCTPGQMTVKRERTASRKRGGSVRQSPSPRYSDPQPTPRSTVQTPDLNQAANRLKRLSLTPNTYYQTYQDSPETAIY